MSRPPSLSAAASDRAQDAHGHSGTNLTAPVRPEHGARPMQAEWVRGIRRQCRAARVPFFFKRTVATPACSRASPASTCSCLATGGWHRRAIRIALQGPSWRKETAQPDA